MGASDSVTATEALAIALAGGAIGAILAHFLGVPAQVRDHNRRAREVDDNLGQWVSDECVRLERELRRHKTESAAKGQYTAGAYLRGIAHIKEDFLHRYRDQEREARAEIEKLRAAEGLEHRLWRLFAFQGPLPTLTTPDEAQPILDGWRAEVCVEGVGTAPVSDPTRRPLEWAVRKYGDTVQGNE